MNVFDPRGWKLQHQVALIITTGTGFILGLIFGLNKVSPLGHRFHGYLYFGWLVGNNPDIIDYYWILIFSFGLAGAAITGGAVYVFDQKPIQAA
jgi:cell shape-determining protein MreD